MEDGSVCQDSRRSWLGNQKIGDAFGNLLWSQSWDVETNEKLISIDELSDQVRRDRVMDVPCSKHDDSAEWCRELKALFSHLIATIPVTLSKYCTYCLGSNWR
jgi:hypothetical protein